MLPALPSSLSRQPCLCVSVSMVTLYGVFHVSCPVHTLWSDFIGGLYRFLWQASFLKFKTPILALWIEIKNRLQGGLGCVQTDLWPSAFPYSCEVVWEILCWSSPCMALVRFSRTLQVISTHKWDLSSHQWGQADSSSGSCCPTHCEVILQLSGPVHCKGL